jgi:hypothetical protein
VDRGVECYWHTVIVEYQITFFEEGAHDSKMASGLVVVYPVHDKPKPLLLAGTLCSLFLLLIFVLVVLHRRGLIGYLDLTRSLHPTTTLRDGLVEHLAFLDHLLDHLVTLVTVTHRVLFLRHLTHLLLRNSFTLAEKTTQVDVGYYVLLHCVLRVDGLGVSELFVVGEPDSKVDPAVWYGFEVLDLLDGY